jgi:hypothetical protein
MKLSSQDSKKVVHMLTLAVLFLLAAVPVSALPPVAWSRNGFYEVSEKIGDDGVSEDFYPAGESAARWTERVLVRKLDGVSEKPLNELMEKLRVDYAADCAMSNSIDMQQGQKFGGIDALHVWFCYREKTGDKGRLEFAKLIRNGQYVYLMVAGGHVPAYLENSIPKEVERQNRWIEAVGRFVVCRKLTQIQCVPGDALLGRTPIIAPSAKEQAEITLAVSRGKALYNQDYIAWHGTDFAVAKGMQQKPGKGIGFIAIPTEGRAGTFYLVSNGADNQPQADSFIAGQDGKFSVGPHLEVLPGSLTVRLKALKTARQAEFSMCSDALNTAVIQHENGSDWWVYMMSATKKFEEVWIGGHSRIHVSADGAKVLSATPSTKACLSFNAAVLRSGSRNSASPITQILTDTPNEYHVMQSLTHAVPIMVVTDAGVWRVSGDKIEKFSTDTDQVKK